MWVRWGEIWEGYRLSGLPGWSQLPTRSRSLKCCPWGSLCLCGWWNVEDRRSSNMSRRAGAVWGRPGTTSTSHSHYAAPDRPALLHSTLTQYSPISRHGPVPAWSQVITAASSCPPTRRPDCSLQHSAAPAASPRPVLMQIDLQSKRIRKNFAQAISNVSKN